MSLINSILKAFVGDKSQKDVKAIQPLINKVKTFETALASLSHDELRAKTTEFKEKIKVARAEKDSKIEALKVEAENTTDIDKREDIYTEIDALEKEKNNNTLKGDLIKKAFVTSTMGVSYKIKLIKNV